MAGAMLLAGCATVRTTPYLERTTSSADALPGLTYSLPMLQYDLVVVRTLMECPGGKDRAGEPTKLKFAVDVSGESRYVPGEAYTVDSSPLIGLLKTSSFEVNYYPSGTLKSIGIQAEDKSGEVIVNTAKIAAAGLMIATGSPAIAAAAAAPLATMGETKSAGSLLSANVRTVTEPQQLLCTDAANADVTALTAAEKTLKTEAEALRRANQQLKILTDEIRLKVKDVHVAAVQAEWAKIVAEQTRAGESIRTTEKAKADLLEKLGVSQTYRWPEDFASATSPSPLPLSDANRVKMVKLVELGRPTRIVAFTGAGFDQLSEKLLSTKTFSLGNTGGSMTRTELAEKLKILTQQPSTDDKPPPAECLGDGANVDKCLDYHLGLRVTPTPDWPSGQPCAAIAKPECIATRDGADPLVSHARDSAFDEGVFVREPAQGLLIVCRDSLASGQTCAKSDDIGKLKPANFPQLGQLRFLKFKVAAFQAKDMGLFLTEDGRVQRYYMKSTKAAGEALTSSLASATNEISGALEKRETERQSDAEYAQNKEAKDLQAQITLLDNQQKLKKLKTVAPADPLAPVREEAAENEVYIAQLESQLVRQQLQIALERDDDAAARALLALLKGN